ncbi:UDP-N-acetylmuramoyl-L-alanyl-D-glutamate--2,6-diaminopimelate ligase [Desulfuribacillus stibiiarsenatis]|uniref:UDP-N-acetylmuramoyl-L-alanyl-D-glutamate--2,6-diaminopimelate ligase n=1 Tax=Desulfuribacillus stibiiarsenatis TaxID=1390249 RepID=A0A1E5L3M2_9FIRM|nr:UDP-N-acetylmuramoyl-L-alanyl-D-glutamate--2,6-diaminopimelate ligase [Desulfuribacillus stibiiarsenatis]OEH84707.1 UDP-N-acetylmuramoyl-L-alanyl-D-glutamate--2,6-diaminopimelate ligase [Desulfuribacillus stibiiarsenatis]
MKISDLFQPVLHKKFFNTDNIDHVTITQITSDSRKVESGSLFACVPGHTVDGHDFAAQAVQKGAIAILCERQLDIPVLQIVVPNTSQILPLIADRFYGQPTRKLKLIGITGTNGKTTTTYLIEKIMKDYSLKTGVIGTIEMRIGDERYSVENTTPEPITLQESFHRMVVAGVDTAIIEVSSHALELGRVAGCDFDIAGFTNLTQDHLDFHKDMDEYKRAKAKLFSRLGNTYSFDKGQKYAVLNADDDCYEEFKLATVAQVLSYGIEKPADVSATNLNIQPEGVSFVLHTVEASMEVQMKMTGKFSVYNALTAISVCLLEGIPLSNIITSIESVTSVDGRFEKVDVGQDFTVLVDYAHTSDSLENVLKTIQEFAQKRVITVFGCGGDRDRSKRPLMGAVAREYSDFTIVTSDNPRTENPTLILDDVMVAFADAARDSYIRIEDRTEAIEYAVNMAESGDIILIAGKGHETYQIIGKIKSDYDDRLVAKQAILVKRNSNG